MLEKDKKIIFAKQYLKIMTLENEITLADLKIVKTVLKKLSNQWAKKLAEKMFPDETEERGLDKVYSIIAGGQGRDQETRSRFIKFADEIKAEFEALQTDALSTLKSIKS